MHHEFLLFRGGRGWPSRFFIASRTEIGTGSMGALMTSGPMIALGLKSGSLVLGRCPLFGSRMLMLRCRSRSAGPRSLRRCPCYLLSSNDASALSSLRRSQVTTCASKSLSMMRLLQMLHCLVREPQDSTCLAWSANGQEFSQYLQRVGFLGQVSWWAGIMETGTFWLHISQTFSSWNSL